jgi:tRNA(His) 5'-end guanylyltransferase
MKKDDIGNRMKSNYEDRTRICLPRRTHTIIRIDGKAFHTYTRGLTRPFDDGFIEDMDATAAYLCKNIQNAKFAYVQSDEISILLSDYDKITTDAWFDNNIQKMASVSASMATRAFNEARTKRLIYDESPLVPAHEVPIRMKWAEFDSRVFQIPEWTEVENYFIWRQQDCVCNSILSVAQSLYSHKEMNGKNTSELQEMIFQKGTNWNDFAPKYKRGRVIRKDHTVVGETVRSKWISVEPPSFTQERQIMCFYVEKAGQVF